jgi:predicted ATP-grasp superfamily ATP-dependent carboligase
MNADLIIVGGSVRAAAASARRAGLRPWCADLYGDLDTIALSCGPPARIRHFAELPTFFAAAPNVPWVYTGCLENRPALVARLAHLRPLWGNTGEALAACRSPVRVAEALRQAGLPALEIRNDLADQPTDRAWVRKALRSCGGQGVRLVSGRARRTPAKGCYFQEFVSGTSMSAVFVSDAHSTHLLGVTEQLVHPDGIAWLNARPFAYAGSIGPVQPSDRLTSDLQLLGEVFRRDCGLRGLYGVDFICRDDRPWVVEVNPRYTASIEVLERATGVSALGLHRQAFDPTAPMQPTDRPGAAWVGKAVVFSPEAARVRYARGFHADETKTRIGEGTRYADLPADGSTIPRGAPFLTVFAEALNRETCEVALREAARRALEHLGPDVQ